MLGRATAGAARVGMIGSFQRLHNPRVVWGNRAHLVVPRLAPPACVTPPPLRCVRAESNAFLGHLSGRSWIRAFASSSTRAAAAASDIVRAACDKPTTPRDQARAAPQIEVLTVQPRGIPFTLSFVAQTEGSRQANIVTRVSGVLDRIAYQEGELTKSGQLMFELDRKPFQAQLDAARGARVAAEFEQGRIQRESSGV
jgi:multidrug efflux pump subunit AcrA (membrane-fusion protein)